MNPRAVESWLQDIVDWGEKLARHVRGMNKFQFLADEKTQDAAAKCAEAIGMAAWEISKIEPELDAKHPDLRLSDAYSSRNRLSHGYHSIDYGILWNTVTISIPVTVAAAKNALAGRKQER